jgi:hypothetical protein
MSAAGLYWVIGGGIFFVVLLILSAFMGPGNLELERRP